MTGVISIGMGLGALGALVKSEKTRDALGNRLGLPVFFSFVGVGVGILGALVDVLDFPSHDT